VPRTAPSVGVVGAGMITAVGLSAAETAASVRAATARFAETSFLDKRCEPFTLAEVPEDGLPELVQDRAHPGPTAREIRMLRLGAVALRECLKALPRAQPLPGLSLALPEAETAVPWDRAVFLERLAQQAGGVVDQRRSDASHRGRAGGLAAIGQAAEMIRTGGAPFMVAGGIDTYRDLFVLGTLDAEQRVKSAANLDGFIPGEGAAFLLLGRLDAGPAPLARVSWVAQAEEEGHLYSEQPYRGEGLASAIQQLFQSGAAGGPIQEVYSSMNGENHWAKEWGVAFLRSSGAFLPDHGMHHPADCYGDTGAASGVLLVGLAALGIKAGYRRSPALVYGSSDRGLRAALTVSAV
jgi:3-oxoacyl-[acyl-carrier-protein] synthase-1